MLLMLHVKPLSVNKCWQGRRYKTKDYKAYEKALLHLMPNMQLEYKEKLKLNITFGFSTSTADIDNPLKPLLDCLQKKYGFNDRYVYELTVKKELVKKGEEFIQIQINEI
jgi:Holliday junction resolvase RusA-like endonuclease